MWTRWDLAAHRRLRVKINRMMRDQELRPLQSSRLPGRLDRPGHGVDQFPVSRPEHEFGALA
jgi:hypothetical protein